MSTSFTAIIHLRPLRTQAKSTGGIEVKPTLELVPGVDQVQYEPIDETVTVNFDGEKTGLSELVGVIEDLGLAVSGIAQRRSRMLGSG